MSLGIGIGHSICLLARRLLGVLRATNPENLFLLAGSEKKSRLISGGKRPYTVVSNITPSLPDGLIFEDERASISGVPAGVQSAVGYSVTMADQSGEQLIREFQITIAPTLTISQSAPTTAVTGQAYNSGVLSVSGGYLPYSEPSFRYQMRPEDQQSYQIDTTGELLSVETGRALPYIDGLPNGLSYDSSQSQITGTPQGLFDVVVSTQINDAKGFISSDWFPLAALAPVTIALDRDGFASLDRDGLAFIEQ